MDYTDLNEAEYQTRFLKLSCRRNEGNDITLEFDSHIASLDTPPPFTALSYCWGRLTETARIQVDGKPVYVGKNLKDALLHCGLELGESVWADAVCINQANIPEKNYQLKLIGRVYSQAKRTVAWLGLPGPYTHFAEALLRDCAEEAHACLPTNSKPRKSRSKHYDRASRPKIRSRAYDDVSKHKNYILRRAVMKDRKHSGLALCGVRDLLSRPYWERVWIIQEIAKSHLVQIRCGQYYFDIEMLFLASVVTPELPKRPSILVTAIRHFRQQERSANAPERMSLLQALIYTRNSKASDQRDKIYAILGLSADGHDLITTPTYGDTETLFKVCQKLTVAILSSRSATNAILLQQYASLNDNFPDIPFVINWLALSDIPPWLCSVAGKVSNPGDWDFEEGKSELRTQGRLITHVQSVSSRSKATAPGSLRYHDTSAITIIADLSSCFIQAFASRHGAIVGLDDIHVRDALARMIRDAHKGHPTRPQAYDFDRTRATLDEIGSLCVRETPLWYWVIRYNELRQAGAVSQNEPHSPVSIIEPLVPGAGRMTRRAPSTMSDTAATAGFFTKFLHPPTADAKSTNGYDSAVEDSEGEGRANTYPPSSPPHSRKRKRSLNLETTELYIPSEAFRAWEEILYELDGEPGFSLLFALLGQDYQVAAVHPNTEGGDEIFQVAQCHLPVVLRRISTGKYWLVGEACLGKGEAGEKGEAREWMSANQAVETYTPGNAESMEITILLEPQEDDIY